MDAKPPPADEELEVDDAVEDVEDVVCCFCVSDFISDDLFDNVSFAFAFATVDVSFLVSLNFGFVVDVSFLVSFVFVFAIFDVSFLVSLNFGFVVDVSFLVSFAFVFVIFDVSFLVSLNFGFVVDVSLI